MRRIPLVRPAGIHHVSICVADAEAALAFYCDVLGLTQLERPDFDGRLHRASALDVAAP
jgi:catechol 2,3-dioxygenase-like lactoylglutathione lyase family enzyme